MECPFRFIFVQSCDCIYRSGSGCYDIESCPGNSDAWCAEQIESYTALSERHQRLVYLAALAEDYLHHIPLDGKGLGIAIALKEELEDMGIDLKAALEGEE